MATIASLDGPIGSTELQHGLPSGLRLNPCRIVAVQPAIVEFTLPHGRAAPAGR
jgi:hypothetical protein